MTQARVRDLKLAARVRAARKAAGFSSASHAATGHDWPKSLYRAQESATRSVRMDDIARFATAFNVTAEWLLDGQPQTTRDHNAARRLIESSLDRQRENASARQERGSRLTIARVMAAFTTQNAAAQYFGWSRDTLSGHEAGRGSMSPAALRLYCAAFGVHAAWLRDGIMPSGLGANVDNRITTGSGHRQLSGVADPNRRGDIVTVKSLSLIRPTTKVAPAKSSKIHNGQVEFLDGSSNDCGPASELWQLRFKADENFLLARVLSATPDLRFQTGDILIIKAGRDDPDPGRYAICDDGLGVRVFTYEDYHTTLETMRRTGQWIPLKVHGRVLGRLTTV